MKRRARLYVLTAALWAAGAVLQFAAGNIALGALNLCLCLVSVYFALANTND